MSRGLVRSAVLAAALSGALVSAGGARADARPASVPSCGSPLEGRYTAMGDRDGFCRPALRTPYRRPVLGAVRTRTDTPRLAAPSRYVSLLILGIGY